MAGFTVAVNRQGKKNNAGEAKEEVLFMPCNAWNKQAESVAQFVKKRDPILVEGFLRERQWQNEEGQGRSRIELTANRVQFLGSKRRDDTLAPTDDQVAL